MRGSNRAAILLASAAAAVTAAAIPAPASAAETIVYRYDARGRLVLVERRKPGSNDVVTQYSFDKADNRLAKTTTGSPNPPPP